MNRLVIIGNGFDLAHGLPTGYCDFIDWFWSNIRAKYKTPEYQEILEINDAHSGFLTNYGLINNYNDFKRCIEQHAMDYGHTFYKESLASQHNNGRFNFSFKSLIFKNICTSLSIQNWVDIEIEYYRLLKECLEEKENNSQIRTLNQEFKQVKKLFQQYLTEVIEKIDFSDKINEEILKVFEYKFDPELPSRLTAHVKHKYLKEFPRSEHNQLIKYNNWLNNKSYDKGAISTPVTLFLNFNYTSLIRAYMNQMDRGRFNIVNENQIHGSVQNPQIPFNSTEIRNDIIFGFGDEMDDEYKAIEKKNDNNYFENIKSFGYFQTTDYRDLRASIDSGKFQVIIMGHSCGLSDRVLLNTIFEHQNCCSIKVFYYERDGKDNYNDIVQNISRHFNKKEMMRERIVPKNLCKPLPQIKLH